MPRDNNWLSKSAVYIIFIVAGTIVYLYFAIWLVRNASQVEPHYLLGIPILCPIANGIVTQIQMLITVILVLFGRKLAFMVALSLSTLSLFSSLLYVIRSGSANSAPGVLSYIGTIIIVLLIRNYKQRIKDQVSLLRNQESELRELAYYDSLTGVLNRRSFIQELDQQLYFSSTHDRKLHVVFIDIDDFKMVNDTLGHHVGDHVLQELALRIKKQLHASDIIGRLGGDEIGLIIRNDVEDDRIRACLKAIHERAIQPTMVENKEVTSTVSMGASSFPTDGTTSEELLRHADIAMYQAKINGKSSVFMYCDIHKDDALKTLAGGKGSYGAQPNYGKG